MKFAYVDTSCLVAIAFDEPSAKALSTRLRRFDRLFSSNLLEAELRSALAREAVEASPDPLLDWISWVYPNRPLTSEFNHILSLGYVKGADLWHLACALFLSPDAKDLAFLSFDSRQRTMASKLGFSA